MSNCFYTYVLYSPSYNRFYIGQCQDIVVRGERHNAGLVTSTKPYLPWKIVGFIEKPTRKEAIILEKKLKNLNTEDLRKFIAKYFNNNKI